MSVMCLRDSMFGCQVSPDASTTAGPELRQVLFVGNTCEGGRRALSGVRRPLIVPLRECRRGLDVAATFVCSQAPGGASSWLRPQVTAALTGSRGWAPGSVALTGDGPVSYPAGRGEASRVSPTADKRPRTGGQVSRRPMVHRRLFTDNLLSSLRQEGRHLFSVDAPKRLVRCAAHLPPRRPSPHQKSLSGVRLPSRYQVPAAMEEDQAWEKACVASYVPVGGGSVWVTVIIVVVVVMVVVVVGLDCHVGTLSMSS
ncbi:hypothetical protein E2C01_017728 [Portunus trituberculatus]|uniref:Uncharacterized protein n=1 Tax=Portunus trituberculatus TaxID=210409 RepID=A0A5B7DSR9_PORTR|nr:hypothetical protein [Portunus trituberculatus]